MQQQSKFIFASFLIALQLYSTMAQRPSFAGSRPSTGHNQKDKYNQAQDGSGIANRFGETQPTPVTVIAFGQPQRPPVGYPVVQPETVFVPISAGGAAVPQFSVDNRIGGTDNAGVVPTVATRPVAAGGFAAAAPTASNAPAPSSSAASPLPLDARGDQLLVDQLNSIPEDRRPFWFLNSQAIEAQRNGTGTNFSGAVGSRGSFFG